MHLTIYQIVLLALGLLELIVRVVPTTGMYAPLGIAIKILSAVSEFLNKTKS